MQNENTVLTKYIHKKVNCKATSPTVRLTKLRAEIYKLSLYQLYSSVHFLQPSLKVFSQKNLQHLLEHCDQAEAVDTQRDL